MIVTPGQLLGDLYTRNYGYISALDLAMYVDPQKIIAAENKVPGIVQAAVDTAVDLVTSPLLNIYDLTSELKKTRFISALIACTVNGGVINAAQILGGGTGYTGAPALTVVPVAGDTGVNGALTAEVSDSVLSSIEIVNAGGSYTAPPAISFIGGNGIGAAATCTLDNCGRVATITITNPGHGWTDVPVVMFTGDGLGATAKASVAFGKVINVDITTPGTLYLVPPTVTVNNAGVQAPVTRNNKLVCIVAINAARIMCANDVAASDSAKAFYKMADQMLDDMRAGMGNLPLLTANSKLRSGVELITDRYNNLG